MRKILVCASVAATLVGGTPPLAAPAKPKPKVSAVCSQLRADILANEKQLGYLAAKSAGGNSAATSTALSAATTALYAEISSQKQDLRANSCPAYPHVISRNNFMLSAMECLLADLRAEGAAITANPLDKYRRQIEAAGGQHPSDVEGGPSPCDRDTWER